MSQGHTLSQHGWQLGASPCLAAPPSGHVHVLLPLAPATHLCCVGVELLVRRDDGNHWRDAQQVLGKEGRQAAHNSHAGGV